MMKINVKKYSNDLELKNYFKKITKKITVYKLQVNF